MSGPILPANGPAEPERGDAARNRAAILVAARELVAQCGAAALTMDAVAFRAGLGKGTVFRRFGSRAGLMLALLDQSEREFQQAFMFGPPPLGPGAPARERLMAFGRARLAFMDVHGEVERARDLSAAIHFGSAAARLQHTHLEMLLRDGGVPGDARALAYYLAAGFDAGRVAFLLETGEFTHEQLAAGWEQLVDNVLPPLSE
ncbi:TetR/AcrR family transcriptional regulator [Paenarthrobacter sp. DKR-5]|uniref:TetR/AcrR family transcriptional regulator n=1 Tax=Paenarthrobacter sp. DKR-5 TaxID=2835535 RepID=UPI001BDD5A22|nr:TetR/AcrR family transcriptional regulator [Paenarthrobacter sp. DKR-5]MBT1004413.1 TetR/AcrR family transcriptional regulator [Paenarthrobacter sp. DKR-5]